MRVTLCILLAAAGGALIYHSTMLAVKGSPQERKKKILPLVAFGVGLMLCGLAGTIVGG